MEYPAITAVANETSIENKIMEDPLACNESPGDLSNINTASCKSEKDEIDSVSSNSKEQFNDAQKMLDIDLGQFGEIKDGKKPYINSSLSENVGLTENSITNYEESTLNDINAIDANSIEAVAGVKRKYEIDDEFPSEAKKRSNTLTDEKKIANLRKNIRDVMGENQLDTNTLVAQREESERLARVAEQQKLIREYQRQTAVNKQNVRTQNRVISLLQSGNTFAKVTDILDDSPVENSTSTCSSAIYGSCSEGNNNQSANIDSPLSKDKDSSFTNTSTISNNDVLTTPELPINDVVTIEDSSSEDDCILLSDDEEEDIEEETEDDPNNSGLHVKDAYNVPDEQGRVVVNIGHPEGEEDIFVAPQIAKTIKPHQIGGVRFLFDNIIESTKRFNSSTGFGCILAHSMGLGKTLQVVCFCDIFLRHTDSKTVLCVMPINTLQNWVSEFNMWTPKESYNPEEVRPRTFNVFVLNDQQKTLSARAKVILKWAEEGGVLLMGYELFRLLALKLIPNRKRRVGKHVATEKIETEANKRLSESIYKALVKPGPDLVICDEGHRIKNSHAGISLALKQIRTRRRIVLTGYPLQNNLLEYWCMVDFVRPNYLGTRTEFSNMFERPIQNGQCIDSTPEDIKLMRYRAHVLHSLLVGFVQRRSHVVLQQSLPQKLEYVILTKMTSFQRKLYDTFMNDVVRKKTVPNPLKAFAVCCKIWNHPDVLYNFLKKRETDLDLEIDDAEGSPDISTSLKDNLDKNEKSLSVSNFNDKTKLCNTEPQITATNIGSKTVIKDLKPPDASFHDPLSMPKDQLPVSKSEYRNMENVNLNKSYGNEYYTQTYYQCNNTGTYAPEGNGNNYWHDSNTPYYGYQPLCNDIGSPLRPDYVGMVVKKTSEMEISNSSSQIVDLDTKEIKTVETDIDVAINQIMNNTDEKKTSTTRKGIFKQSDSLNESSSSTISHPSSMSSLSSPNNNGSQNFEKESLKVKGEDGIPYDWAIDIMKGYEPNLVQNSPKMEIFFCILNESIKQGDRVLVFSQSLLTLNLIEKFLQSTPIPHSGKCWARNASYFRLDGSTTSQEREKLVNDFNSNADFILFLISTKAGSLGINLVGANRVIVFDASWNPCHDTQAVYRIYRYGQQKPCFVYRIVMDKCLEKKIYDRQVKKQGMSDRVVDECNPDAHLSMKDVTNLCYDFDTETDANQSSTEFSKPIDSYSDIITQKMVEQHRASLSKEPFYHESLLIDRKEKKLSQAEKRQAQRGYELEKKASSKQVFNYQTNKLQYRIVRNDGTVVNRPVASVRPMQTMKTQSVFKNTGIRSTRWIPAEVWQRQGMTAQEMTLPLDVVIPTNSSDKSNIILKSGQRVMVLKSPKGIYMQLESGKIIAIRTSSKVNQTPKYEKEAVIDITSESNNSSSKTSSISKDNFENSTGCSSAAKGGIIKPSLKAERSNDDKNDVVIVNDDSNTKLKTPPKKVLQSNFSPKIGKSTLPIKKVDNYEEFGYGKESNLNSSNSNTEVVNSSTSQSGSTTFDQNSITNSKKFTTENTGQDVFPNFSNSSISEEKDISNTMSSFLQPHTNSKSVKSLEKSQTQIPNTADVKNDIASNNMLDNSLYTCSTSQVTDSLSSNYNTLSAPQQQQQSSQISSQVKQPLQQYSDQLPMTQQLHQHKDPYVSVYNLQHSHYGNKIPEVGANQQTTNSFIPSREPTQYSQYYDSMYDNNVATTYDYPHRYHSSHGSYSSSQPHYHPHFHSFGNAQSNPMSAHPYYMRWPTMPTVAQTGNQHNSLYPPPYSQNGTSSNQWHNHR